MKININQFDLFHSNQNSNKRAGIRAFDLWTLPLIFVYL